MSLSIVADVREAPSLRQGLPLSLIQKAAATYPDRLDPGLLERLLEGQAAQAGEFLHLGDRCPVDFGAAHTVRGRLRWCVDAISQGQPAASISA